MRDINRIDNCVEVFAELWKRYPDMRMGQLMSNILGEYASKTNCDPFFVEDERFAEFLKNIWKVNDNDKN